MSEPDFISIRGAREHNLKNVSLDIPKKRLVVFSGVSGSGKSSLAFDTLYAEGQRRYVESLSAYARQFLGQMEKPKYERIRGLSPTIAIQQKSASSNPRSTVGTITEIYDYLRVLYARAGEQRCYQCGGPVGARTASEIVDELAALPDKTAVTVLAADPDLVIPDPTRSIREGAVAVWGEAIAKDSGWTTNIVKALAKAFKIDLDKPWNKLGEKQRDVLLYGTGDKRVNVTWEGRHSTGEWAMRFEGILAQLERRHRESSSDRTKQHYEQFFRSIPCASCEGT